MNGIIIHNHEFTPYWLSRLEEAKAEGASLDVLALHPTGSTSALGSLTGFLEQVKTKEYRALTERVFSLGIKLEYEFHALSWLLPREMFATHPELFRENKEGERTPDANICPSSEEALDILEERSALLASLLPQNGNRYFYWLDDVRNTYCHCARCRSLTPSDQAMIITNRMLRGIRRTNPSATLAYLAYINTIAPPVSIRPEPGIFLEYAPIDRDLTRPLSDAACEKNIRESSHILPLLDYFGCEGAQALDYWIDNSLYCEWHLPYKPLVFPREVMVSDVALYRSLGFEHITSFACYLGEDYAAEFGIPPITDYAKILKTGTSH